MKNKTFIIIFVALLGGILLGNMVIAPFIFIVLIPSSGTVTLPIDVSSNPSTLDWGTVTVGASNTKQVNLTNSGTPLTALNMTYGNATTNLVNYTVTWDAEGLPLPTNSWLLANFTLAIYEANITASEAFTLDVWINDKG